MAIINTEYQQQLAVMHSQGRFGNGSKVFPEIHAIVNHYKPKSILDFGCGHGALIKDLSLAHPQLDITGYDPGNTQYSKLPNREFDLVVSSDVFEHIEPQYFVQTLQTINNIMKCTGWFRIACYPAKKHLPDGRNAHLIVEPPQWWRQQLLDNMNINIVNETINHIDKSHKWPGVVGKIYDVTVEAK